MPLRQTDAVWIRDLECLLFKEWARQDVESSSLGEGFVFTAVAYTDGRQGAPVNTTDYFFAIDPERAAGRHLYPVWTALQAAEIQALGAHATLGSALEEAWLKARAAGEPSTCRLGFAGRAGALEALFDDPWY